MRQIKLEETTVADDYGEVVRAIDPRLRCQDWLSQPTPAHCDHWAICQALEAQAVRPVDGNWRVGKYHIREQIGGGGGSVVLLASDPLLRDRNVALKVPLPPKRNVIQPTHIRSVLDLFREACAHRSLPAVPGLVRVYEVHAPVLFTDLEDEEFLARVRFHLISEPIVIVMDYEPGDSLEAILKKKGGQPYGTTLEVAKLLHGIATPVLHLHKAGRVHRDIKPQNVLMGNAAVPVLCDLGLAIPITQLDDYESLNRGTLNYLAPEQINVQFGPVRAATDIWALGVIMFEAATGKRPFDCDLPTDRACRDEIYKRIQGEHTPAMSQFVPDIDPEFVKICETCLEKEPQNRFASVSDFLSALTAWIGRQSAGSLASTAKDESQKLGLFAWNPQIYSELAHQLLVFLIIEVNAQASGQLQEGIRELLSEFDCRSYRIYYVLGRFDFVVRGFFSVVKLEALRRRFNHHPHQSHSGLIRRIEICTVAAQLHHWHWGRGTFAMPKPSQIIDILKYLKQPEWWLSVPEMQTYMSNWYIRRVIPTNDRLVFFVLLRSHRGELHDDASGSILRVVSEAIESPPTPIENTALYELQHADYVGVIKAEARNLFHIGGLVQSLNESLAPYNCVTMTCVAADPNIEGREDLDISTLTPPSPRQMTQRYLPTLFAASSSKDADQVIDWAINYVLIRQKPQDYLFASLNFIDSVLCTVRDKDYARFILFIWTLYRSATEGITPAADMLQQNGGAQAAADEIKGARGAICFQRLASLAQVLLPTYSSPGDWDHVDRLRDAVSPDAAPLGADPREWLTLAEALFTFHENVWQLNRALESLGRKPFGDQYF